MEKFVKVGVVSEIKPGQGKAVLVGDREVAVFNYEGRFYAIDNVCPHQGGPLSEGDLDGKLIMCPWHCWRFDVTTGASAANPGLKVPTYPVKIEGDEVFVSA